MIVHKISVVFGRQMYTNYMYFQIKQIKLQQEKDLSVVKHQFFQVSIVASSLWMFLSMINFRNTLTKP